ncbi:MAG: CAP domain-containing protein [Paenibacillaceae bacterium]
MYNQKIKQMLQCLVIYCVMVALVVGCLLPVQSHAFGRGAQGPDVYAVQGMMKSLGYYAGVIDGKFGVQSMQGVKLFQRQYGLPVTGAVDSRTLESILWAYAELKIPKDNSQTIPTPTNPPATSTLNSDELLLLKLVNQERTSRKLASLTADAPLSKVAEVKSQDMADNQYFSHQSPTYGSPFEMMKQFGIVYQTAGENIACNQTVEAAHKALMESTGHRENILSTQFTHIGIGIVNGGPCGKMLTQQFIGK